MLLTRPGVAMFEAPQKRVFVQEGTGQLGMEGHENSGFLDHVL